MQKEWSLRVFEVCMEVCSRRKELEDRRVRLESLTLISWMIYSGARELMALNVMGRILKMMRSLTGSQWRLISRGDDGEI